MTRFDTRWTKEQKQLFERASSLGGFRSLSEFVFFAVRKQAEEIIEKHEGLVTSQRDREIFFQALLNPPAPNADLKKAAQRYLDLNEDDELSDRSVAAEP